MLDLARSHVSMGSYIETCTTRPDCTVDDFPEYGSDIDRLSAAQRGKIVSLAQTVFNSLRTNAPIRLVLVVGHADTALRFQGGERARKELEVSNMRAKGGEKAFLSALERVCGHKSACFLVVMRRLGVGASKKRLNARTEAEMRLNRRVEFYLARDRAGPPNCRCEG